MSAHADKAAAWVYRGVWRRIVEWFRVPDAPPVLPAHGGDEARAFKPDPGLLRYQKFWFWIGLTAIDLAITAVWIVICIASPMVGAILFVPYLIVAFVPDILAYVALHLRYDTTWYVMSSRSMRIRRGIWTIHETTITYENIQNVDVGQGPIERMFGISTLIVRTAGGGGASSSDHGPVTPGAHVGKLEGIANPQELREQILQRAAMSRGAGLGDDRRESTGPPSPPGWSPAHVDMVREIRDQAVALRASAAR